MESGVETPNGESSSLPVGRVLTQLNRSFDELVKLVEDGGLDGFDDPGLVGFMQGFETFRNRLPLIDHRMIRGRGEPGPARHADPIHDEPDADRPAPAVPGGGGPAGPGR